MANFTIQFPELKNDRIIRAAKGLPVDQIPVWLMRQAGRYLPEFQAVRREHEFFEICRSPELACQITLQPVERYDVDAAIIFSDILVIPQALGVDVVMKPGVGPVIPNPINEPEDLARLNREGMLERLTYVGEAITLTRQKLDGKVPLIGFAGAPWTIMSYMIEGGGSKTLSKAKKWLYKHPEDSRRFLAVLTEATIEYLVFQVKSGAQLLQIFESHCEHLNRQLFNSFIVPTLKYIRQEVEKRLQAADFPMVPFILFCKGGYFCLEEQAQLGYDVLGIDWTVDPHLARKLVGPNITLQGNLDPPALYSNTSDLVQVTEAMVNAFGKFRYIANLGHGIYPDTPVNSVATFVQTVHCA